MENKENNVRHRTKLNKSRIPLPMNPLPPVPKHLRTNYLKILEDKADKFQRLPLKTLNNQGASSQNTNRQQCKKPGTPLKINTKHVTVRKDNSDLDWSLKIFNVNEDDSVISISDDEEEIELSKVRDVVAKHTKALRQTTPILKNLEHSRIKNIKRSLKRPHSKELQGVSPAKTVRFDDDRVKRRLSFKDRIFDRLKSPESDVKQYMKCLSKDYTSDIFEYLLKVEKRNILPPGISTSTRACVINWLIKVNGADGNPATIQSACWFYDAILCKETLNVERLQLVASACCWISQKLTGTTTNATKFVKCSNRAFTQRELLNAERIILACLKFPTQPVVQHDFINYFAWCCDPAHPGEIEVAATFICMSGILVNPGVASEYPSAVAAAAVRNALLLLKKNELMPKLQKCYIYRKAEAKATNFSTICCAQRIAVRTVADSRFDYQSPYEHYGAPPFYIAKIIVKNAESYAIHDVKKTPV